MTDHATTNMMMYMEISGLRLINPFIPFSFEFVSINVDIKFSYYY